MSGSQLVQHRQQNAMVHPYGGSSGGRIVAAANNVLQRREGGGVVGLLGSGAVPRSLGVSNQHVNTTSFALSSSASSSSYFSSSSAGTTPGSSSISTPSVGDRDDEDSRGSRGFNRGGVQYIINFGLHEVKRTVQCYVSTLPTRVYPFK